MAEEEEDSVVGVAEAAAAAAVVIGKVLVVAAIGRALAEAEVEVEDVAAAEDLEEAVEVVVEEAVDGVENLPAVEEEQDVAASKEARQS